MNNGQQLKPNERAINAITVSAPTMGALTVMESMKEGVMEDVKPPCVHPRYRDTSLVVVPVSRQVDVFAWISAYYGVNISFGRQGERNVIAYETKEAFIMTEQHHHALLSGLFAENWARDGFLKDEKRDSVLLGIANHDRGWIDIDESPLWNDAAKRPYTFIDYPWIPKLAFYKQGIDELEALDAYAALLASLHYCSFFQRATHERAIQFIRYETERQEALKRTLQIDTETKIQRLLYHFTLLQFCDDLSLYMCMQRPGISKSEESDWYRDGFDQVFDFALGDKIMTQWKDNTHLMFNHFPFTAEFDAKFTFKKVTKKSIQEHGMTKAYHATPYATRTVRLVHATEP